MFSPTTSKKVVLVGGCLCGWMDWQGEGWQDGVGGCVWGGGLLGLVLELTDERDDRQILLQQL